MTPPTRPIFEGADNIFSCFLPLESAVFNKQRKYSFQQVPVLSHNLKKKFLKYVERKPNY